MANLRYANLRARLIANSHDSETLGVWITQQGKIVSHGMRKFGEKGAPRDVSWSPCRMWDGSVVCSKRSKNYYPRYSVRVKALGGAVRSERAHRAMFEIHYGIRLNEHHCNHKCGNTLCINPLHLEKTTHKQNMRDRDSRVIRNSTAESVEELT